MHVVGQVIATAWTARTLALIAKNIEGIKPKKLFFNTSYSKMYVRWAELHFLQRLSVRIYSLYVRGHESSRSLECQHIDR